MLVGANEAISFTMASLFRRVACLSTLIVDINIATPLIKETKSPIDIATHKQKVDTWKFVARTIGCYHVLICFSDFGLNQMMSTSKRNDFIINYAVNLQNQLYLICF